mmetsp:Transcript_11293/g.14248  ORF Transcript_11293/g.14248 Transcript_11293/m.14248 type:complete len:88 (+) Transcript_11293:146-409(+)
MTYSSKMKISSCDSSGADKTVCTIVNAETEAMTADNDSDGSKSDKNEDEKAIILVSQEEIHIIHPLKVHNEMRSRQFHMTRLCYQLS